MGLGWVGTAEWTGVRLSILLDRAGVKASGCHVVLEGADGGMLEDPKGPPGELKFARSIPVAKARANVLLAYKMNGRELPPEHGFPLRAIVPGWYAMASIKWLQRIIVTDQPFTGYYQTIDYAYWESREGIAELTPLTEMQIKAQIAKPGEGDIVRSEQSRILIGFNTGIYQSIDLSSWIAGNTVDVLATNFNKPESLIRTFPRKDVLIAPGE